MASNFGAAEKTAGCPGDSAWVHLGNPTAAAITLAGVTLSPPVTPDMPYHLEFR
jgi:hypothetical protein